MTVQEQDVNPTAEDAQNYGKYLKPKVQKLLKAAGLDKAFTKAEGDYLYYLNDDGEEQQVIDFLGGYGVSLFGHNHPVLLQKAMESLKQKRPFAAQASIRSKSAQLAKKLASKLENRTGNAYIATLANSGAEAVEAAIKHAILEKELLKQTILETQAEAFKKLRLLERAEPSVLVDVLEQAQIWVDGKQTDGSLIMSVDDIEDTLLEINQTSFEIAPTCIALKGAFHGKSSGALKLTHNQEFREPWEHIGIETEFVEQNNVEDLKQKVNYSLENLYLLEFDKKGRPQLVLKRWSNVVACFVEPIQGEGGIHELRYDFAQILRSITEEYDIPLVMDEIQSGMGRSGTFLASEPLDIVADYYLFSKALGGGLAKVAALLIKEEHYIEDFGYLHTSTFAEDDFASSIALKALELVEENNGALMQACSDKGQYIKEKLNHLVEHYPDVFVEVRGRGLLLGLELTPQHSSKSNFMRMLSQQNLLTYLICGYVFNVHHIRITPTLSANTTIRIEPSAYIEHADIDKLCIALEDVAKCIQANDCHTLVHFLFKKASAATSFRDRTDVVRDSSIEEKNDDKKIVGNVACVGHFMKPQDLVRWDPYLSPMTDAECNVLLEKTQDVLEPFLVSEQIVSSASNDAVNLSVVGIPYIADQLIGLIRNGKANKALEVVKHAHQLAVKTGAIQIGFTGYSSIATNNCRAIIEDKVGVTSGNSLTAALSLEAMHKVMDDLEIDIDKACLGVVGGAGNIGRILAEIESEEIPKLLLIGREGSQKRLKRLASAIYLKAWQTVKMAKRDVKLRGVAKKVYESGLVDTIPEDMDETKLGEFIFDTIPVDHAAITISTSMQDLASCNVVISATNTAEPIIFPEHISSQKTVVCDVSVPADVDASLLEQQPNARVISGGIVQLPTGNKLDLAGMEIESGLDSGQLYACIAETVLLGLSGMSENFSYGPLEQMKVKQIRQLCKDHGFEVVVKTPEV